MIELPELLALITSAWPDRYARGRILHVHKNAIAIQSGATIHLRILLQQLTDAETAYHHADNQGDNAEHGSPKEI